MTETVAKPALVHHHPSGHCPVCGALSIDGNAQMGALLAVCDVLVIKTLETVGKRIVRAGRERFRLKGTRPWHEAHTIWPPDEDTVTKALRGAWDVVPALLDGHGCCGITARQVSTMLDEYVRDLVITGTAHNLSDLEYRFNTRLNLPVPAQEDLHVG